MEYPFGRRAVEKVSRSQPELWWYEIGADDEIVTRPILFGRVKGTPSNLTIHWRTEQQGS